MLWSQDYDPTGSWLLSASAAALPLIVLLALLAFFHVKAHWAALVGLMAVSTVAVAIFGMPVGKAGMATLYGVAYGLLPIGWIITNVIFMYTLTDQKGLFEVLKDTFAAVTPDHRLQLLLIAFSFGAFFEGAAGFGTPIAVTATILIGLGFSPLAASGYSLIANTAPVAYGALGTPIIALSGVTGIDAHQLGAMIGRQLPFFSLLVPFWLITAYAGFKGMRQVWPALAVAGVFFAVPQFLLSNLHGPWLVDVGASVISMAALVLFLLKWRPKETWAGPMNDEGHVTGGAATDAASQARTGHSIGTVVRAWTPWAILSAVVFLWGLPEVKAFLDGLSVATIAVPDLDKLVQRVPPVVAQPTPEAAVYVFNWVSATGTGIFLAAVVSAFVMGYKPMEIAKAYWAALTRVRFSLLTVASMMAIGFVSRYSGLDGAMGLAFAKTGVLYPFFGTLLGWFGVALTGSDTSSDVLFGSLQRITAERIGISPTLMAAANSSGGVMGKMIDAQSIVVASTATRWYGHEGDILRFVFFHSIALAALVGLLVFLQAYVFPFTQMVLR
jgi:lactate permease